MGLSYSSVRRSACLFSLPSKWFELNLEDGSLGPWDFAVLILSQNTSPPDYKYRRFYHSRSAGLISGIRLPIFVNLFLIDNSEDNFCMPHATSRMLPAKMCDARQLPGLFIYLRMYVKTHKNVKS